MKKIIAVFLLITILVSCNSLEKKLEGGWVIDQAYYHNDPVVWDLYSNGFDLNEDNTCYLPPINARSERTPEEEKGTWKAYKANDKSYLKINTENQIFNRIFEVHSVRKVRSESGGYLLKMTLKADSLKMDCTKALYE